MFASHFLGHVSEIDVRRGESCMNRCVPSTHSQRRNDHEDHGKHVCPAECDARERPVLYGLVLAVSPTKEGCRHHIPEGFKGFFGRICGSGAHVRSGQRPWRDDGGDAVECCRETRHLHELDDQGTAVVFFGHGFWFRIDTVTAVFIGVVELLVNSEREMEVVVL